MSNSSMVVTYFSNSIIFLKTYINRCRVWKEVYMVGNVTVGWKLGKFMEEGVELGTQGFKGWVW